MNQFERFQEAIKLESLEDNKFIVLEINKDLYA